MLSSNEAIRNYKEGDELAIVKLIGQHKSSNWWDWQYGTGAQSRSWINVAEVKNEIVASYAVMRNDLNFRGCKLIAGSPTDTIVRYDQRGKGWYTKIAKSTFNYAFEKGAKAIFGFPNRNSYPGFMRNLGGYRIASLKYYYQHMRFEKFVGISMSNKISYFLKLKNRFICIILSKFSAGPARIVTLSYLPDSLQEHLKKINDYEVLSVWKDLAYLRWRYQNHPENKYNFHLLYIQEHPVALIVSTEQNGVVKICEILHERKDIRETVLLLRKVALYYYYQSRAQKIEFYGFDQGFFDTVFALSGFNKWNTSDMVFAGRVLNDMDLQKQFMLPNNWTIAWGDSDVV